MKKEELIKYKVGIATLLIAGSMFLGDRASNSGFKFVRGEDNNYIASSNSFISNNCINNCYVIEVYNELTEENEMYIAKKCYTDARVGVYDPYYYDLLSNNKLVYEFKEKNTFFELINETPLYNYMAALDLLKERYSYEDMQKVYSEIASVYEFENEKELIK